MAAGKQRSRAGRLRIVAGNWRSRLLEIADVDGLRPTPERVRETVFNWLAPHLHGANCLDLCAGTGAMGLEALSRGAARAVFVENSAVAAASLQKNIRSLNASTAEVLNVDARNYLAEARPEPFDIVFLDPPFGAEMLDELCRLLSMRNWLAANARVYLEMARAQTEPHLPQQWRVLKNKTAGNVRYLLATPEVGKELSE